MTLASGLAVTAVLPEDRSVRLVADADRIADARPGHVRLSPFFYNVQDDHVAALDQLATRARH
jgi:hypothetical protein